MQLYVNVIITLLLVWLMVGVWRLRKRQVSIGPAAAAAMTDMLDDQRRAAIEIILEDRAAKRDPEDRDGNLPRLARGATAPKAR
jgi:hypothetical protein